MMMRTVILDVEAMTSLWKRRMGLEEPRTDCTVVRGEGPDIDAMVLEHARSWYSEALRTMPSRSLPLTDISDGLVPVTSPEGVAGYRLPEGCLRVVEVTAGEWLKPARIVDEPTSTEALALANPYSRGGSCGPVAVIDGDVLLLSPSLSGESQPEVMAVVEPGDDTFILTSDMMARMPLLKIE